MAALPPLLVLLLLLGSGNKGVKRDTKAAERLQRKGAGLVGRVGMDGAETRIKAE